MWVVAKGDEAGRWPATATEGWATDTPAARPIDANRSRTGDCPRGRCRRSNCLERGRVRCPPAVLCRSADPRSLQTTRTRWGKARSAAVGRCETPGWMKCPPPVGARRCAPARRPPLPGARGLAREGSDTSRRHGHDPRAKNPSCRHQPRCQRRNGSALRLMLKKVAGCCVPIASHRRELRHPPIAERACCRRGPWSARLPQHPSRTGVCPVPLQAGRGALRADFSRCGCAGFGLVSCIAAWRDGRGCRAPPLVVVA